MQAAGPGAPASRPLRSRSGRRNGSAAAAPSAAWPPRLHCTRSHPCPPLAPAAYAAGSGAGGSRVQQGAAVRALCPLRTRHRCRAAQPAAEEGAPPGAPDGPLTEEQLRQLTAREDEEAESAVGEAWRAHFAGDLEELYNSAARDETEWLGKVEAAMAVPRAMRNRVGAFMHLDGLPPGLASDVIGMGTWRMRGTVHDVISWMVSRIEGAWRELLEDDLTMYPPAKWKAKGWDFLDSVDPAREWDGWSFADIADPPEGGDGYPRLLVENRLYCSRAFRKLHLEVAARQDGLQVLHMVMYPRYDFDLPILALDLVIAANRVTLVVADACPLSANLSLPRHYMQTMMELQEELLEEPATSRRVPEWGQAIFSPLAVCTTPESHEGLAGLMSYCVALTRAHILYSSLLEPLDPGTKDGARRIAALAAGHQRFVSQQLANQKTSRVLDKSFGPELTDAYMRGLMFDFDPSDSPPWYDTSISRLYEHMRHHPEPWRDGEQLLAIRRGLDVQKAQLFLERFIEGETSIAGERLQFALSTLYDTDADFRDAADEAMPDLPELRMRGGAAVGARLEKQLLGLLGQQQQGQQQGVAAAAAGAGAAVAAGAADAVGAAGDSAGPQQPVAQPPDGKAA